jgi:hypothetical protein
MFVGITSVYELSLKCCVLENEVIKTVWIDTINSQKQSMALCAVRLLLSAIFSPSPSFYAYTNIISPLLDVDLTAVDFFLDALVHTSRHP